MCSILWGPSRIKSPEAVAYEVDMLEVLEAKQKVLDRCAKKGALPELQLVKDRFDVRALNWKT